LMRLTRIRSPNGLIFMGISSLLASMCFFGLGGSDFSPMNLITDVELSIGTREAQVPMPTSKS
jgi:hypothetical protein